MLKTVDKDKALSCNIDIYQCEVEKCRRENAPKCSRHWGEETRIKVFGMLRDGSLCACKILESLSITQPTLSHHMKVLCDCGLVTSYKDWKWTYYSLDCHRLIELLSFLSNTACMRSAIADDKLVQLTSYYMRLQRIFILAIP